MKKEIYFDEDLKKKWLAGVEKMAKAVGSTLGPCGRFFALAGMRAPVITKDGVSVAKDIDLIDPVENSGARLMREVALRTNDTAGDGTSTSIVFAAEMVREGYKAIEAGCKPIELKRGMDKASKSVLESIKKTSKPITNEDIEKVATISANNDPELGGLVAKAINIAGAGADSIVNVEATKGIDTSIEETSGLTFESGWASSYFVNNKERNEVNFDDALILLTDKKIARVEEIAPYLESSVKLKKPLLIVCESLESEALNVVILNLLSGNISCAAVKCPGYGQSKLDWLEDISTMTGATLITDATGAALEDCGEGFLGEAKTVIVTKSETSIISGKGDPAIIEKYVNTLKEQRKNTEEGRDKEKLDERIARFSGSAATIKVGASTDTEAKEIKDRLIDAVCAVKAAFKEGISPGAGINYINAEKPSLEDYTEDMKRGAEIVFKALEKPLKQIAENAGLNGDVILANCLRDKVAYNARTEEYGDAYEMGIIEPTLVQTEALSNAVSVAGVMIATSGANIRIDEEDNK